MNKKILRPALSKILLCWLVMSAVVIAFSILLNWVRYTDPASFLFTVLISLLQCLVFSLIFFNLPYFKVEVSDAGLSGPQGFGLGWQRIQIPLADVDLQHIQAGSAWLGFYAIKSKTGGKLSLWGFDEKQLKTIMARVTDRSTPAV